MEEIKEVQVEQLDVSEIQTNLSLTKEDEELVEQYCNQIDLTNTNSIINYGASAQEKISQFSDAALDRVKTKDLGVVSDSLTSLVTELKGFNALEEKKGLGKLFGKAANPIVQLKAKYATASSNVEKVVDVLDGHQVQLTRDISVMDELFKANTENYKTLSLYIEAGKKKLEEAEATLLEMKQKAEVSGDANEAQAVSDFSQMMNRFEKKLYDLDLTRSVSLQMAPQIRMLQNNDSLMIEKIQTVLVNTIPLWKSQMVLALGLANSEEALKAQRAVTDTTNELLRKNMEVLNQTTVGIAKESERGIIDLDTLKETNTKLISTIDEVLQIQKEGHEGRLLAETELRQLEEQLKEKVLSAVEG